MCVSVFCFCFFAVEMLDPCVCVNRFSHVRLIVIPWAAARLESFIVEKSNGSRCAVIGGCWCRKTTGGLTRSEASLIRVHIWLSLLGSKLKAGAKTWNTIRY